MNTSHRKYTGNPATEKAREVEFLKEFFALYLAESNLWELEVAKPKTEGINDTYIITILHGDYYCSQRIARRIITLGVMGPTEYAHQLFRIMVESLRSTIAKADQEREEDTKKE